MIEKFLERLKKEANTNVLPKINPVSRAVSNFDQLKLFDTSKVFTGIKSQSQKIQ